MSPGKGFVEKEIMVGRYDELEKLKYRILEGDSCLEVASVVGMAGIGKTTLVKQLYNDESISNNFKCCAFVSVGPEFNLRNILIDFQDQLCINDDIRSDDKMQMNVFSTLYMKRYLIVLDDVWSISAWLQIKRFLPNTDNSSRVIMTTRLSEVAHRASNYNRDHVHQIRFLNKEESWNLFCKWVFDVEACPNPSLGEVGKKIIQKVEGLPLGIISIANFLSKGEMTLDYWEKVAANDNLLAVCYTTISKALLLSYEQLPQYLHECFLYLGVFPLNHEIPVSKLVKLWVAEGFIVGQRYSNTLEDTAEEYLKDLISRSIVLIRQRNIKGRVKTCTVHYFYWHLCVREAEKDKIFHIMKHDDDTFSENLSSHCRLCIQKNVILGIKNVYKSMASVSNACSILCTGPNHQYPVPICLSLKLLKVFNALSIRFYKFPDEILESDELRYLAFTYNGKLPSSISSLKNLLYLIVQQYPQTIINSSGSGGAPSYMPMEIWKMQELIHLQVMGCDLPNPPAGARLSNLLTLLDVSTRSCTKEVLQGIPNLEKLGLQIVLPHEHDVAETLRLIDQFSELHELKWVVSNPSQISQVLLLPESSISSYRLTKLTLSGCGFAWKDMSMIGAIPYLHVLKLRCYAFQGPEWVVDEEEFSVLEYLLLEDTDLVHWEVGYSCFRQLRRLIISHCYKLEKIPFQLGDSINLKVIELVDCNPSALASAKQIQEEERERGDELQIQVYSSLDDEKH